MKEHTCVKEMNDLLEPNNTQLAQVLSVTGRELVQVATEKRDSKVRKKPVLVFASYCPFCGNALKGMV
jgi:thiol-disulfide isomerase/thioredoxin